MAHDRLGKSEFPLTQEFVAMMLGASPADRSRSVAGTVKKGSYEPARGVTRQVESFLPHQLSKSQQLAGFFVFCSG